MRRLSWFEPLERVSGGSLDPEKRRALREFYREEFARHIEHLTENGLLRTDSDGQLDAAYRKLLEDLDQVCGRSEFPALAEALLQRFDVLTRLSEHDPRRGH
jgi:hypothetical protein